MSQNTSFRLFMTSIKRDFAFLITEKASEFFFSDIIAKNDSDACALFPVDRLTNAPELLSWKSCN